MISGCAFLLLIAGVGITARAQSGLLNCPYTLPQDEVPGAGPLQRHVDSVRGTDGRCVPNPDSTGPNHTICYDNPDVSYDDGNGNIRYVSPTTTCSDCRVGEPGCLINLPPTLPPDFNPFTIPPLGPIWPTDPNGPLPLVPYDPFDPDPPIYGPLPPDIPPYLIWSWPG